MPLTETQIELCETSSSDFSDLRAVYINCTLKPPEQASHTALLMETSAEIMRRNAVDVDVIRPTAHQIAFGVHPDMTNHGWARDDWPELWERIRSAQILGATPPS